MQRHNYTMLRESAGKERHIQIGMKTVIKFSLDT